MTKALKRQTTDMVPGERRATLLREDGAAGSAKAPKTGRKSMRRRQIDPTTCDRDYSSEELDFMRALESYKRSSGRMFPTCSEILEVVKSLGYSRLVSAESPSTAPQAAVLAD